MGDIWIENTMRQLEKKAIQVAKSKKESLKGKFDRLNAGKTFMEELYKNNEEKKIDENGTSN